LLCVHFCQLLFPLWNTTRTLITFHLNKLLPPASVQWPGPTVLATSPMIPTRPTAMSPPPTPSLAFPHACHTSCHLLASQLPTYRGLAWGATLRASPTRPPRRRVIVMLLGAAPELRLVIAWTSGGHLGGPLSTQLPAPLRFPLLSPGNEQLPICAGSRRPASHPLAARLVVRLGSSVAVVPRSCCRLSVLRMVGKRG